MTKTEFKKTVAENNLLHTYGNGRKRLLAIFWDWHTAKNKEDGHGYKYMIVGDEGIPKSMIVDIAYDICIKKEYVISITPIGGTYPCQTNYVVEDKSLNDFVQ